MKNGNGGADRVKRNRVRLRLDAVTLAKLRELGPEWQDELNGILRAALDKEDC
jgi:uncharacterized protein (DUF4415 family)